MKKNILFICTNWSSFVKNDYEILRGKFDVETHLYKQSKNLLGHLYGIIKLFGWLSFKILRADFIYVWFADYHSILPTIFGKIFGRETYLVLGGYDVAFIPEINYGSFKNPLRKLLTSASIKLAHKNLAVSEFIKSEALKKIPNANVIVLYNGVNDFDEEYLIGEKSQTVITVGQIDSTQRVKLKGIDFFISAARRIPEYEFKIIGLIDETKKKLPPFPKNVTLTSAVKHNELIEYYKECGVYCQFSMVESFGLSLAEAMYFGAVGVANKTGALEEIIGETGFIIKPFDIDEAVVAIKKAMQSSIEQRKECRRRIKNKFMIEKRKKELLELLQG